MVETESANFLVRLRNIIEINSNIVFFDLQRFNVRTRKFALDSFRDFFLLSVFHKNFKFSMTISPLSKRKKIALIVLGVPMLLIMVLVLWGFAIEPNRLIVKEATIKLPDFPQQLDQLKIVAISDRRVAFYQRGETSTIGPAC